MCIHYSANIELTSLVKEATGDTRSQGISTHGKDLVILVIPPILVSAPEWS